MAVTPATSSAIQSPVDSSGNVTQTALGSIPAGDYVAFTAWLLKILLGVGGGIAFILMLIGAIQILTSSGDPEKTKAGQELITSAVIGLMFIIFSLFLLNLIGHDIFGIPGFNQ
jgi:hypothetical protein